MYKSLSSIVHSVMHNYYMYMFAILCIITLLQLHDFMSIVCVDVCAIIHDIMPYVVLYMYAFPALNFTSIIGES